MRQKINLTKEIDNKTLDKGYDEFILYCKSRNLRAILYYFMKLGYMDKFHISEIKVDKKPIETYTDKIRKN